MNRKRALFLPFTLILHRNVSNITPQYTLANISRIRVEFCNKHSLQNQWNNFLKSRNFTSETDLFSLYGFQSRLNKTLRSKLSNYVKRYNELEALLSDGQLPPSDIKKYSIEFSQLSATSENAKQLESKMKQLQEIHRVITQENDQELITLAKEELVECKSSLESIENTILHSLVPKDEADSKNAIIELRPGTGGKEASLFTSDMFKMYQFYATLRGWKFDILYFTDTDVGGCKEASASISGENVFGTLKHESGVHRVQRVPDTETQGRVHTSTMTVVVLPEAEEVDIKINEKDLRIDVYRSSGAGGQHVNKTESAVRITHIPTGTVVAIQDEKSQHRNKDKAMKILRSKLYEAERNKKMSAINQHRSNQIGSGERHERIRTYNFPQNRVTDHRTGVTSYEIEKVMNGEALDNFIDAMKEQSAQEALKILLDGK